MVFARRFARTAMEADDRNDPQFAFVVGCVVWGLLEWEGVGSPAPVPSDDILNGPVEALAAWREANPAPEGNAPVTAEYVTALLRQNPAIYDEIDRTYVETIMRAAAEKKGSGRSQTGTSTAVPPSARPAATAQSAPTAKTTRAPRRAKGSGRLPKAAQAS
ncbi:hypothetical protein EGY25_04340 [Brevundimonas intermedia]|uniref:Uncharacterized protein n=1 Tax=Brevundimonas intermedia TaxID=74315 RepID=A0A4Y9S4I3_9CAUL|nr:hypothetical protein [Brevundimonas intermedia]TFW14428.1 hypothetical protein EGY25_04340 [Brevundimonas intermedia]